MAHIAKRQRQQHDDAEAEAFLLELLRPQAATPPPQSSRHSSAASSPGGGVVPVRPASSAGVVVPVRPASAATAVPLGAAAACSSSSTAAGVVVPVRPAAAVTAVPLGAAAARSSSSTAAAAGQAASARLASRAQTAHSLSVRPGTLATAARPRPAWPAAEESHRPAQRGSPQEEEEVPPRRWEELLCSAAASGESLPRVTAPAGFAVVNALPISPESPAKAHCIRRLAAWHDALGPIVFKVGIAADPAHRFWNGDFGYHGEKVWHFMEVMWRAPACDCRELEIELIAYLRGLPGCRNERPGGEGVRPDRDHTCFVYMVVAACGNGISLERAWAERRAESIIRRAALAESPVVRRR